MTTQYTTIQERITKAGACIKTSAILLGAFGWAALCLGAWFLLFVLDNLLDLPAGLRLPLSIGGSALVLIGFFRRVARPVARRQRPERTARMLESRYEVQDNTLINASQFEQHRFSPEESVFASRTITQSQGIFEGIRLAELLDLKNLCKWGGGAALFILLWIIYAAAFPRYVSNAWARFAMPLKDIPPASSLLLQIEPGT
ncbi:MAG: hypothetical protein QGF00_33220, partial [Planctomycetota bacterium]|nr:hypothetical protein [Planctomycetota bacterium]